MAGRSNREEDFFAQMDGKSLIVPDYGDVDDMSSLGTSKYTYRGDGATNNVRYIGDMKIVSKDTDPAVQYGDYDLQKYDDSLPTAEDKDADLTQSFEEKKDEEEKATKSNCIPLWIIEAPLWLKLIIIASIALLIGALVLIVVGGQLSGEGLLSAFRQDDKNSTDNLGDMPIQTDAPENSTSESGAANDIVFIDLPAVMVATSPAPTNAPSLVAPTEPTTASPTGAFTKSPTGYPTKSPTVAPTKYPTVAPTKYPTQSPTKYPTVAPTEYPTQSPTSSKVNFLIMGGRFDGDDTKILENGLKSLPNVDDSTILIHLGDWNSPYTTSCDEDSFITNVNSYKQSSVPVYFVPGDNEYNDCPNPTEALDFWNQYLLDFETKYWPEPSWNVVRQSPDYSENFAFLQRKILFVGINLVGGIVHDQAEWDARHEADLLWIDTTAAKYDGSYTTMVIFAHADPEIQINQNFFSGFYPMVERYDEQVIFVHRNLGIDTWKTESGYNGIRNLEVVAVEGSKWPPMWMQIDNNSGTYTVDQSSWYDEYIKKGKLP